MMTNLSTFRYQLRSWRQLLPRLFLSALFLSTIQGCAATTTFTSYTGKISPLIGDLEAGRALDVNRLFATEISGSDEVLYLMERGRIAQIVGKLPESRRDFEESMAAIRVLDEKASVSASDISAQMAAVTINDNAIPYGSEGYERVLLHQYQAMNFLFSRDLERAAIEVRRANAEQELALRNHEKELEEAREEADKRQLTVGNQQSIDSRFAHLDEMSGSLKNSFQNAYTFYLSALVYELLGQPNDAYIDYRKALEIYPGNVYLVKDVKRLAAVLGVEPGFLPGDAELEEPGPDRSKGELVLFLEDGFVPQKEEVKISLPVPDLGFISIAFPLYTNRGVNSQPETTVQIGAIRKTFAQICNVKGLAVKSLKEKIPVMVIRHTLRAVAKGATAAKAKKSYGLLGELASSAYNVISENADLRSWNTLPESVRLARVVLPAGRHQISLWQNGKKLGPDMTVTVKGGGKTVARVVRAGGSLYTLNQAF